MDAKQRHPTQFATRERGIFFRLPDREYLRGRRAPLACPTRDDQADKGDAATQGIGHVGEGRRNHIGAEGLAEQQQLGLRIDRDRAAQSIGDHRAGLLGRATDAEEMQAVFGNHGDAMVRQSIGDRGPKSRMKAHVAGEVEGNSVPVRLLPGLGRQDVEQMAAHISEIPEGEDDDAAQQQQGARQRCHAALLHPATSSAAPPDACTLPLRSSLPQPTQGPNIAVAAARITTPYMIWR